MKNKILLVSLATCALFTTGCAQNLNPAEIEEEVIPTGYWYLGDNGQRVWRTIKPENVEKKKAPVTKNYPSPFGNG